MTDDNKQGSELAVQDQKPDLVPIDNMKRAFNLTTKFYREVMNEGEDYGVVPGTNSKSLFQSGAEKLARLHKMSIQKEMVKEVTDFDKGFFYYKYRVTIARQTGEIVTQMERSCNSFERKYRYYRGKPKSPDELAQDINTYESMAQKRAFVAAVREAAMAGTLFSDKEFEVEDIESEARRKLYARYFTTCVDRGFTAEGAKAAMKRKHGVESFRDLTDQEIEDGITLMESTYEVVGKGNKPKKISNEPPKSPETVLDGEIVEEGPDSGDSTSKESDSTSSSVDVPKQADLPRKCYQCEKPLEGDQKYYCSDACQDKYYGKSDPLKNRIDKFQKKLEENKNVKRNTKSKKSNAKKQN